MYSIIVFFVVLPCLGVHGECYEKIYKLDGQIMQVIRDTWLWQSNATHMYLEACDNQDPGDLDEFDLVVEMANATHLEGESLSFPPLPESSKLETVVLVGTTPRDVWGGCPHLQYLELVFSDLSQVHRDWLANCTRLRELRLERSSILDVAAAVSSIPEVHILEAGVDNFQDIVTQKMFATDRGKEQSIREVSLNSNYVDASDSDLAMMSAALARQLAQLSSLGILSFSGLEWFDMCALDENEALVFQSLEVLKIDSTQTSQLCFRNRRVMPKLKHMNLQRDAFTEIQFNELFSAQAPILQVDVGGDEIYDEGQIRRIILEKDDYSNLINGSKKGKVSFTGLSKVTIDCDCQNSWLVRSLREGLVSAPTIVCSDGTAPVDHPARRSDCDRYRCGKFSIQNSTNIQSCICERDWADNFTIAECRSANLSSIPPDLLKMTNLVDLIAYNNHISKLPKHWPDNIQYIDLTGNAIWQLGEEEAAALFSSPSRRVKLAGNPIVCTCDNRVLLNTLKNHRHQIKDYREITCAGNDTLISEVDVSELCAERDFTAALTTAGLALAVIIAITTAIVGVLIYYRRELKIFLFARRWCLCCITEDELDADRIYDVFLSFCHKDTVFITENLLPVLDKEYKVCIHFRDWFAGEMITTQISTSVELSKRTVIILSKNFLDSTWGLLEFRTAHISALLEGRVRVIVVVIDDVLDGDIQGELKSYIRANTYMKWDDPWFWDKLRFALPHRTVDGFVEVTNTNEPRLDVNRRGISMESSMISNQ